MQSPRRTMATYTCQRLVARAMMTRAAAPRR
jgi:hypothetical protein